MINPVEMREASLELPETLQMEYDKPETVATIDGFREMDEAALQAFISENGLAMDFDDIMVCQNYYK